MVNSDLIEEGGTAMTFDEILDRCCAPKNTDNRESIDFELGDDIANWKFIDKCCKEV